MPSLTNPHLCMEITRKSGGILSHWVPPTLKREGNVYFLSSPGSAPLKGSAIIFCKRAGEIFLKKGVDFLQQLVQSKNFLKNVSASKVGANGRREDFFEGPPTQRCCSRGSVNSFKNMFVSSSLSIRCLRKRVCVCIQSKN